VGATVNVAGDTRSNYYGLLARASYFIDPDGKLTGVAPGFVADAYIMHVDYSNDRRICDQHRESQNESERDG